MYPVKRVHFPEFLKANYGHVTKTNIIQPEIVGRDFCKVTFKQKMIAGERSDWPSPYSLLYCLE